jgi:hypothetical protein
LVEDALYSHGVLDLYLSVDDRSLSKLGAEALR